MKWKTRAGSSNSCEANGADGRGNSNEAVRKSTKVGNMDQRHDCFAPAFGGARVAIVTGVMTTMIRLPFILVSVVLLSLLATRMSAQTAKTPPSDKAGNQLVTALWFSHGYATPQLLTPGKDRHLKHLLIGALRGKSTGLAWEQVSDMFDKSTFQRMANDGNIITLEKMERMLLDNTPPSRKDLFPKIRQHADLLTTQFDLIEERRREGADALVAWIEKNYHPEKPLPIIVICTGNSRRSMLGSTMGNIAAAYYGLPTIRFYSGGTTPSAFNPRAIATLKEMGLEVESSGKEAARGKSGEENPIYRVRWGKGLETQEFSKMYSDAHNPQKGFAAILVCSEADASCPAVEGASARIAVPYDDPKLYDGAAFEAAKYAERRDDMGRFMLSVLMQARRRLEVDSKLK
jgi:arsenate reductase (thioredoxin)